MQIEIQKDRCRKKNWETGSLTTKRGGEGPKNTQFLYLVEINLPKLKILKYRNVLRDRREESKKLTWMLFHKCTPSICFLEQSSNPPKLQFFSYKKGIIDILSTLESL